MFTYKYGKGGEHIPQAFQPGWYAEEENGVWLPWRAGLVVEREPLAQRAAKAARIGGTLVLWEEFAFHALLVPCPNAPAGWFFRWDLFNGWTGSLYNPALVPGLTTRKLSPENPFAQDRNIVDFRVLADFAKLGNQASYHYADDSGKEWRLGQIDRDAALLLWKLNPHLEQDMLFLAKDFLWSFSTFVEEKKGGKK